MDEALLTKMASTIFDSAIMETLKMNKFIITDERVLHNNQYLIYKTPKNLSLLQNDGSLVNVIIKVYFSYIETNIRTGVPTIKKASTYALKFIEEGIENENETKENVISKVLYELSLIHKKGNGKIKINLEPQRLLHIQYINRGFNTYEVFFQKKDGSSEKKVIYASNDDQVNFLANYNMKINTIKYDRVDFIYKSDFAKSFWEKLFIETQKRKKLKIKDLLDFTRKLYKYHKAYTSATPKKAIETLVANTGGNIRATAIAMSNIMKENGIENIYETFSKLNEEDQKMGKEPNFDNVYLSILKLSGTASFSFADAYKNLSELIERKVFLSTALKSAIKGPAIVLVFLILVGAFTINMFAPILFEIYSGIGEPLPPLTVAVKGGIDYLFTTNYPTNLMNSLPDIIGLSTLVKILTNNGIYLVLLIYLIYVARKYFTRYTFYGRKSIHNIVLTIPIFGNFFKKSEYEIFLTVRAQLYGKGGSNHGKALPILKTTIKNYHIQGVVNTAANNFNIFNVAPGEIFVKYPLYIDEKVANLFKTPDPDESEMLTLKDSYKIDNDEFILNLKSIIQNVMLLISGGIVLLVIMSTIIPMLNLATKI